MTMPFVPPRTAADLRIEIVDDLGGPALAAQWEELAAASAIANPFYERANVLAARNLPEAAQPRLLLAWRVAADGARRLDGVLPIARRRARRWLPAVIENWDQRARALGEPLIAAGREAAFWRAALPALAGQGLYLRLSALDAGSASTHFLMAHGAIETRRYSRAMLAGGASSAEHCAAHIRAKVLKEHRRLRARLGEQDGLAFDRLAADADPTPWTDTLFALETSGWKGREGVAASADPATEACYRAMIVAAQRAGTLDFHRMTVGGRTIAMLANLERGDTGFQLKIAYDEDYAAFSPGVLLEMAYLGHALDDRRLALVDSCARAGHPMIDRIWPERRVIVSLAVPFATPASRIACATVQRLVKLRRRRIAT